MTTVQIIRQYLWVVNTLMSNGRMTLEELSRKWQDDKVADGRPLQRSTFNRHRDAILSMFGIIIDCDLSTYQYYISNPEGINDDSTGRWLLSTLTVHGLLADSAAVKDRLVLETVPAGGHLLSVVVAAIKTNRRLLMTYQKFSADAYQKTVCPYALKLYHRRWYMLARTADDQMRTYALDRVLSLELTNEPFTIPADFSPQDYFAEYFGVLTDSTPIAHVIVRARRPAFFYLRTLPLHHSQRELGSTADYVDFSFDIRPTDDFLGQLLSHGSGIEVLEPQDVRAKMQQLIAEMLKNY